MLEKLNVISRNLIVGLFLGYINIFSSISLVAMIFSGSQSAYFTQAIGIGIMGNITLAFVVAYLTRPPLTFAEPQETVCVFLSLMIASAYASMSAANMPQESFFPTFVAIILASTFVLGITLFLLGYFRKGFLIRFIPFPVIGGFIAGIGALLFLGGFQVSINAKLTLDNLAVMLKPEILYPTLFAIALLVTQIVVSRYTSHYLALIGIYVVFLGIFYIGYYFAPELLKTWLIGPFEKSQTLWPPISLNEISKVDWIQVLDQLPLLGAMLLTCSLEILIILTSYEMAIKKDVLLDNELQAGGIANIVTAGLFGLGGYQSYRDSTASMLYNINNRAYGLITGLLGLLTLIYGVSFIELIPRPLIGGYLLACGVELIDEWLYRLYYRLPILEYLIILLIFLVIIFVGFLQGIVIGVIISALLFVVAYSRINVIKHAFTGQEYRSNVERPRNDQQWLRDKGERSLILQLHGFLFFGTVHKLIEHIQNRMNNTSLEPLKYLILDFRLVTDFDSSAVMGLKKLEYLSADKGFQIIFAHLSTDLRKKLAESALDLEENPYIKLFDTLDYATEWSENELLTAMKAGSKSENADAFVDEKLSKYMIKMHFEKGDYLIKQGQEADTLFFIETGSVTVILELEHDKKIRLRKMRSGTVVGDIGFYLNQSRTTSVIAEESTTAYCLTKEHYNKLLDEDPALAEKFNRYVIKILAERVTNSNNALQAFLR